MACQPRRTQLSRQSANVLGLHSTGARAAGGGGQAVALSDSLAGRRGCARCASPRQRNGAAPRRTRRQWAAARPARPAQQRSSAWPHVTCSASCTWAAVGSRTYRDSDARVPPRAGLRSSPWRRSSAIAQLTQLTRVCAGFIRVPTRVYAGYHCTQEYLWTLLPIRWLGTPQY